MKNISDKLREMMELNKKYTTMATSFIEITMMSGNPYEFILNDLNNNSNDYNNGSVKIIKRKMLKGSPDINLYEYSFEDGSSFKFNQDFTNKKITIKFI